MAYQVLYRKYRPSNFDEVIGQEYIVKTIKNAIKTNRLSHAYLFCGPRGTGKTSLAKLFAKTINCTSDGDRPCGECENCQQLAKNTHPDVIELDAASNNSVENIRNITENVKYPPIFGKYKIYIIDEVHMLSTSAFNALLKTLEEPPANVIFILATTDPQKIIPTVLSRCQRYNFSKLSSDKMKERIIDILNKENINYEEKAIDSILELSDGGMRDALSITEQILSYGNYELKEEDVLYVYGLLRTKDKVDILKKLKENQVNDVIINIREMYHNGVDINRLTQDLIKILKEVLLYKASNNKDLLKYINEEEAISLMNLYNDNELVSNLDILIKTIESYKNTSDTLSYLEIALLKLASNKLSVENNAPRVQGNKQNSHIFQEKPQIIKEEVPIKKEVVEKEVEPEEVITKIEKSIIKKESIFDEEIDIPEIKTHDEIEFKSINIDLEDLLSILIEADKEEKNKDMVIYHRLVDYSYNPNTRRYYNILKGSEIFASHKDAIIFGCKNDIQMNQINDLENNKALYHFLIDEYGIDKMVFGINASIIKELVTMFKNKEAYDIKKCEIKRYPKEDNVITLEDRLTDLFGDVKVEE